MGGFFGICAAQECVADVFFGVDYHSHLGTKLAGIASFDKEIGLQRNIHTISDTPFRTKFAHVLEDMSGSSAIGSISDVFPEPLLIRSKLGAFALCMTGAINNSDELVERFFAEKDGHFNTMTGGKVNGTELLGALINARETFAEGIRFAQQEIEGTANILILKDDGGIIAARDKVGRLPVHIGRRGDDFAVAFEAFAYEKLGFVEEKELGPGEIVEIYPGCLKVLGEAGKKKCVCSFLWSYYGYPTSTYEGVNVEMMRYRNGAIMANNEKDTENLKNIDYVGGVPDSGTPHAIGFANESGKHFARAFIKYTPTWARSFMPSSQVDRNQIAKMKQIPIMDLIKDKNLLFVDDSIVRGTQLKETVDFLYENGAKSVHIRSACPPIMYGCKYLNFSRSTSDQDLIARRVIRELEGAEGEKHLEEYADPKSERGKHLREEICRQLHFDSLEFQTPEGVIKAIGIDPCELCTYCWSGKE